MAGEYQKKWIALTGIRILSFVVSIDFTIGSRTFGTYVSFSYFARQLGKAL